ncbi:MAG: hypothetical protein ABI068_10575 [Ktedonobacterales bacterium]
MSQITPTNSEASPPGAAPTANIPMDGAQYTAATRAALSDPARLEALYRAAQHARNADLLDAFTTTLDAAQRDTPDDPLLAAWHYRLQAIPVPERRPGNGSSVIWGAAIALSVALGAGFWLLSDPTLKLPGNVPLLALLAAPLTALAIITFLTVTTRRHIIRAVLTVVALAAVTAFVIAALLFWIPTSPLRQTYLLLMLLHLPLLSAATIGVTLLGWRTSGDNAFAFLIKALEVVGTAGVSVIVGGLFVALTYGMFAALSVELSPPVIRLLVVGGAGLIPVLAVASVYQPTLPPSEQEFQRGFARLLMVLVRAMLPLALLVLAIYAVVIPFNFIQPFVNRDALIIYNVVLFAVLTLIVGVTPLTAEGLSPRLLALLRIGLVAVTALITVISLYALAAILYRTAEGQLTMNRVTVIGWNVINIALLVAVLIAQFRHGRAGVGGRTAIAWVAALHRVYRLGMVLYLVWALLLTLSLPWLF